MRITLYMQQQQTRALGPGIRYGIWVQGCNKRCPGCIAPDAQPLDGGYAEDVERLVQDILSQPDIEGITISGGEPFLQQEALCELIDTLHGKRGLGVIVYTGMLYEEIAETPLAKRCDLIVDGEYIEALNDDLSLRGSSNQHIICISGRYANIVKQHYGLPGRKTEFVIRNDRTSMIGIPSKKTAQMIKDA